MRTGGAVLVIAGRPAITSSSNAPAPLLNDDSRAYLRPVA